MWQIFENCAHSFGCELKVRDKTRDNREGCEIFYVLMFLCLLIAKDREVFCSYVLMSFDREEREGIMDYRSVLVL